MSITIKNIARTLVVLATLTGGFWANAQNPIPAALPSTFSVNYIRTWSATAPDAVASHLITRPLTDVQQSTQYFDGLGRPVQAVAMKASPAGNDMITTNYYDPATGNEI